MDLRCSPWTLPTALFLIGLRVGSAELRLDSALLVALIAVSWSLGRPEGRGLGVLVLGVLVGYLGSEPPLRVAWERPVTVIGTVTSPWRSGPFGRTATFETQRVRQAERVVRARREVLLQLPVGEVPPVGALLSVRGHLRRPRELANGKTSRSGRLRLRAKSLRLVEELAGPNPWYRASSRARAVVEQRLVGFDPSVHPGVAWARTLVLGDSHALDLTWERSLRRLGIGHVLSISGLHVSLLVTLVACLAPRRLRGTRVLVVLSVLVLYVLLVGPRASLLRAALMTWAALGSGLLARPAISLHALTLAVGVLVAIDPAAVRDLGFCLTVGATSGIVVLAPLLEAGWSPWIVPWLRRSLAMSFGAQLGVLPWTLAVFGQHTPLAPLANLLAVPWLAVSLTGSILWLVSALIAPELARLWLPVLDALASPMTFLAEVDPALMPTLSVDVPLWSAAVLTGALTWWLLAPARGRWAVLALALVTALPSRPTAELELSMLDVGQGDAILLRDGSRALLIDGGGWSQGDTASTVLVPALAVSGVRKLEAVLLTHPDRDHCAGLVDLLGQLAVREIWIGSGWPAEGCGGALLLRQQARWRLLRSGMDLRLGRWKLRVLHAGPEPGSTARANDHSTVLLAEAQGMRFLLTGDIEARTERWLLRHVGTALRADVLKVAHHGSRSSSSPAFLDRASPRWALVSVGAGNVYGHPAPEVLDRLRARRIHWLRTDVHGRVSFRQGRDGAWKVDWIGKAVAYHPALQDHPGSGR